ncbi:Heterokaryon incompatibility protein (HET) domain containing protein [Hyaloscypha variabilis]
MAKPVALCQQCHSALFDGHAYPSHHRAHQQPRPPSAEFKYEALPYDRRSTRLLNLSCGSPENPEIECSLIVVNIESTESGRGLIRKEYEALSWCWGTAKPTSYINIRSNGRIYSKRVQPDLLAALKALRHPQQDRYLWIDAICVDQANVREKNLQLEMNPLIYDQAKSVCVWLGEGDVASSMAIKFIQEEVLQLQNFDELCDSRDAGKKWSALLDFMQRPWFSRRWVVHEIALARSAILYCGEDMITWKDFAIAVELLLEVETATHRLSEVMRKDPQFFQIPDWFDYVSALGASVLVEATGKIFRKTKFTGPDLGNQQLPYEHADRQPLLSLEYLVSSLAIFDTSAKHDTIYALLAIAKDTIPSVSETYPRANLPVEVNRFPIQRAFNAQGLLLDRTKSALEGFTRRKRYTVAYESSYVDACKTFVQFCIQQSDPTRALDIICRPWAAEDKDNPAETNFIYENRTPRPKETIPLPSWIPQVTGAPYSFFTHPGSHSVRLRRKNADTLVGLPNAFQRNYNAAETREVDHKSLRFKKRLKHNMHFSMYVKGFVLDVVDHVFAASQGGAIPQEWIDAAGWEDVDRMDPPDEFWRTLVADRGCDGRNPPVYYSRACKESFLKGGLPSGSVSTSDLINNERNSIVAQFCRRVQAVIWNRSLIKTKSMNMGMASKNVKRGDLVCILYGCSVPVILRQCEEMKTLEELAQEREEDFINTLKEVQLRWKKRYERSRRARITRAWRLLVLLFGSIRSLREDPGFKFYVARKYGIKWRKIVRERLLEREHRREITPRTSESEGSEGQHAASSLVLTDNPFTGDPKTSPQSLSQTSRSIPLPQNARFFPTKEDAQRFFQEEVAKTWDMGFNTWLNRSPCDGSNQYYYQFIGEAYIHEKMDGEAMEYQNTQGIWAQVFELR